MKANELRVGNYLIEYGDGEQDPIEQIVQVYEIRNETPEFPLVNNCRMKDFFAPIPLTEEWLKKFGFTYSGGSYYFNEFELETCGNEFRYLSHPYDTLVNSVHSLQNLYFALTGIELTLQSETK